MAEIKVSKWRNIFKWTSKSHTTLDPSQFAYRSLKTIGNFFDFDFNFNDKGAKRYIKAYDTNPLVSMVVDKIASTSASINRVAVDSQGEQVDSNQVLDLINNPNADQNRIDFLEENGLYLEAAGETFVRFVKGVGLGEELRVLEADKTEILFTRSGELIGYEYTTFNGSVIRLPKEEVLHHKYTNIVDTEGEQSKRGLSKLRGIWKVVTSSSEKFNAEASIFKNRGIIGMLTTATDTPLSPKERDRLQEEFQNEAGGSDNYNKIKISTSKLQYLQTGMSPTDLKLLEGILSSLRLICAKYKISSILFNDNDNSTFNNVSEAKTAAFNDAYLPLAHRLDEALSKFISFHLSVDEGYIADLTSIEVLKATQNEVATALGNMPERLGVIAIQSLTDDEIRALLTLGALTENQRTIGQQAIQPTDEETTT